MVYKSKVIFALKEIEGKKKKKRQINKLQIVVYTLRGKKANQKNFQDRAKHPLGEFTWYL